ncbi:MAG: hypothetical protein Q4A78_04475 [Peptostreptococcaceae bacterium]|nr:hypothetical protein [Peptostreptococcaceae bacterium]
MFRVHMRKMWAVLLILGVLAGLTACIQKSSLDERLKMKALEMKYTESFKKRAKMQYGEKAKVKDIRAETVAWNNTVWPIVHLGAGENLRGEIRIGEISFEARYFPDQDVIYTRENAERIEASAAEIFESMGMEVVKVSVRSSAGEYFWLPDEAVDFSAMLQNQYAMQVKVFVTSDLSEVALEDFDWLMKYWAAYNQGSYRGSMTFIQLGDPSKLEKLDRAWDSSGIDFSLSNPRTYSGDAHDYVDVFEHYDLKASIYLSGDQGGTFYYMDGKGKEKREWNFFPY